MNSEMTFSNTEKREIKIGAVCLAQLSSMRINVLPLSFFIEHFFIRFAQEVPGNVVLYDKNTESNTVRRVRYL